MMLKRWDFPLGDEDVIALTRILADGDAGGALSFFTLFAAEGRPGEDGSGKEGSGVKRCVIVLEGGEVEVLTNLIRAGDASGCLRFLRDHFEREIKLALTPHCVPVFESSYKPNQAESFATENRE